MKIKDIALSAAYVGQRVVKAICVGAQEVWSAVKYIVFKDKVVEQICATNWGDGVGITEEQAAAVTDIGTIFQGNTEITSFDELGKFHSVKVIKNNAFNECANLKSVDFANIEEINPGAFANTPLSDEVALPRLKKLGNNCFRGNKIKRVTDLGTIDVFYYNFNSAYLEVVVLPETIRRIENSAFSQSPNLKSVGDNLDKVLVVGSGAFGGTSIEGEINMPNLTSLGDSAFNATKINKVTNLGSISKLGGRTFFGCSSLTELRVPTTVTNIEINAVTNCTSLSILNIDWRNLVNIGQSVFYGCTSLEIEDLNAENLDTIGATPFVGCKIRKISSLGRVASLNTGQGGLGTELEEVVLPTNCTVIGYAVFRDCTKLHTINIENVTSFGDFAFLGCSSLSLDLYYPTLTKFGGVSVFQSTGVKNLYAPLLETAERAMFNECKDFTGELNFPNLKGEIGNAWMQGTAITKILDLGTVTSIVGSAGNGAFCNCKSLTYANMPATLTNIGAYTFQGCSALETIIFNSVTPPTLDNVSAFWNNPLMTIYVPGQSIEDYKNALNWSEYAGRITSYETIVGIIEFADPKVKTICVSNWDTDGSGELNKEEAKAVTDIGVVFRGNTEITSFDELELFNNVSLLQSHAFDGCTNLRSITPPVGLSELKDRVFFKCSSLESIRIPKGVQTIDTSTFYQCLALEVVTFEEGSQLSTIKTTAFYECKNLASITLPSTVTNIENQVFAGCVALQTINIPAGVTAISNNLFYACSALSNVNVANGAKFNTIGNQAFFACTKLVSFDAMDGVVNIGSGAFQNCASFTKFTIPSSVTEIGRVAFYGCTSMQSVICRATTPPTIGDKVFDSTNNCPIYVPDASVDAYKAKENWSTYSGRIKPLSEYVES